MKPDARYSLVAIGLMFFSGCSKPLDPLPPENFVAYATLSTDTITVGDPAALTLTAHHPKDSSVRFPNIGNGKEAVIQKRSSESRKIANGILESTETIWLTSFRIGSWNLITNPAVCTFSNGTEKVQTLPGLVLHVKSSLNATNATKLSDIKDIIKPPLHLSPKFWVPLLIALLAVVAGTLARIFLNKPRTILQMPPVEPPHIIARQALEALRSKPWKPEPFFTELSLILRTYLENRFSLSAPESTTEELTRSMAKDIRLSIKEQQTLNIFLTQADLVKFARAEAEGDVMRTAFSTVEDFIEQTKEEPNPEEGET